VEGLPYAAPEAGEPTTEDGINFVLTRWSLSLPLPLSLPVSLPRNLPPPPPPHPHAIPVWSPMAAQDYWWTLEGGPEQKLMAPWGCRFKSDVANASHPRTDDQKMTLDDIVAGYNVKVVRQPGAFGDILTSAPVVKQWLRNMRPRQVAHCTDRHPTPEPKAQNNKP